jgi:23S rRNA pseudouridine2604 synthase
MEYPIRINKYLAENNICSRREADDLIKRGQVFLNGKPAEIGAKVNENDEVAVKNDKKLVYYAYNKPVGIITHSPQKGERGIQEVTKFSKDVFPLGRLDKDSHGLIILTNDGRVTNKLLSPEANHEKEYVVKVDKKITNFFVKDMEKGVVLEDGYKTKTCVVKKEDVDIFSIILTEGKKRQIRRMCAILGYTVLDLRRIRIMNVHLGKIKLGTYRTIKNEELKRFQKLLGL